MSLTELMSKSTGSAFGLTGGRAERKGDMLGRMEEEVENGGRQDDGRGKRERGNTDPVRSHSAFLAIPYRHN